MNKVNRAEIKIKYHNNNLEKLHNIGDSQKSAWIDLRVAEDVFIPEGQFKLVSLGISMKLPEGYEAHIVPRSSTFKNFGIIQTNSMGVIDNSYSGDNDVWKFPAYCVKGKDDLFFNDVGVTVKGTYLHVNDRICQFRIEKQQPDIAFEEVDHLDSVDRGGFGSTGKKLINK